MQEEINILESGPQAFLDLMRIKKDYIEEVIKADFAEAGDEDVIRKLKEDLKNHNVSEEEIRKKMGELNEKAKSDFNYFYFIKYFFA